MINYKAYRWLRVVFGSRSFKKIGTDGNSYALVYGNDATKVIDGLIELRFVEEWPKMKGSK